MARRDTADWLADAQLIHIVEVEDDIALLRARLLWLEDRLDTIHAWVVTAAFALVAAAFGLILHAALLAIAAGISA